MSPRPFSRQLSSLAAAFETIRISHSVFALPFALASLLLVTHGRPPLRVFLWVLIAMVSARSAAMAFNRWSDQHFDRMNPRTRDRALPAGRISAGFLLSFAVAWMAVFVLAAFRLNPLCGMLSPVALVLVLGYSLTKRFTLLCHLFLGAALGLSPLGAWLAVTGRVDHTLLTPLAISLGVLFWVAAFDVLYALQDIEFDRRMGLFSIPSRLGPTSAARVAAGFSTLSLVAFSSLLLTADLSVSYGCALAVIALILTLVLRRVLCGRTPRKNAGVLTANLWIGPLFLAGVAGEIYG